MRVWVTRTEPQAQRTADRLCEMGHDPVVQPVLTTRFLEGVVLEIDGVAAVAFTSAHAVEAYARLNGPRDMPAFTVGDATALAAQAIGFADARSAHGDAETLARLISAEAAPGVILWPSVESAAADLGALLDSAVHPVRRIIVYRTDRAPGDAPRDVDGVLVHSPRAGEIVAEMLAHAPTDRMSLFAISSAAAMPLRDTPFLRVAVAPRPDETALLSLLNA